MHTYVKLRDGRIMIIWSDDLDYDGTMRVYPADEDFDVEWSIPPIVVHEEDIICIDSNRSVVENYA